MEIGTVQIQTDQMRSYNLQLVVYHLLLLFVIIDAFFWSREKLSKNDQTSSGSSLISPSDTCNGDSCSTLLVSELQHDSSNFKCILTLLTGMFKSNPPFILQVTAYENGESDVGSGIEIMLSEVDCRKDKLSSVVCSRLGKSSNCHIYSRTGQPLRRCSDLQSSDSIWLVPSDRLFIWPTFTPGTTVNVSRMQSPVDGEQIVLETIHLQPKVFRLYNFFSQSEADQLMTNALTATEEEFRLKRSSTGATGYHVDNVRTSENAWDVSSPIAMAIKRRAFELLGVFPYDETLADGLQLLRYNQTTAYIDHLDWVDPVMGSKHNWESASADGTNRFATIVLYFSDVADGGETMFTNAMVDGSIESAPSSFELDAQDEATTDEYLSQRNISHLFPEASWQRRMVAKCRSPRRLSVKPKNGEAVLFYSQLPDGAVDRMSLHGGCPVLDGIKVSCYGRTSKTYLPNNMHFDL